MGAAREGIYVSGGDIAAITCQWWYVLYWVLFQPDEMVEEHLSDFPKVAHLGLVRHYLLDRIELRTREKCGHEVREHDGLRQPSAVDFIEGEEKYQRGNVFANIAQIDKPIDGALVERFDQGQLFGRRIESESRRSVCQDRLGWLRGPEQCPVATDVENIPQISGCQILSQSLMVNVKVHPVGKEGERLNLPDRLVVVDECVACRPASSNFGNLPETSS